MNKIVSFVLVFFFISGSFLPIFSPVSAADLVEDSWNTKTPVPHGRHGFSVVAVDGKIYAIGGHYYTETPGPYYQIYVDNYIDANLRYDPAIDSWTTLASMPTPRAWFAIAEYQGKIYCIDNDAIEVYDIATDSWSIKASVPPFTDRRNLKADVVGGKIFVTSCLDLFMYDPVTDKWTNKTTIPPSQSHSSVVVDDKILFVCLFESDSIHEPGQLKAMIYDPKTDEWSEKQGTEIERSSGIAAVEATSGNHTPKAVYVFGYRYLGSSPMNMYTWIYDTAADTWSKPKLTPTDSGANCVAVVDDIFYIFGTYYVEITMQYVPLGYRSSAYTTPTPLNSATTSEPEPKPSPTYLIVATLAIIIVTTGTGLVFYFNKKKRGDMKNGSILM
jgi:hypothetical protein